MATQVELHLSVMQEDPAVSQLKIYGDLPRLHVRLSQVSLEFFAPNFPPVGMRYVCGEATHVCAIPQMLPWHRNPGKLVVESVFKVVFVL